MISFVWFAGWLCALLVLFVAALRLPELCWRQRAGLKRTFNGTSLLALVVGVVILANEAVVRHDAQLDLTRERVYTPSPEALAVVDDLRQAVTLTYFYRADDPEGMRAKRIVDAMGRRNPLLMVTTIDPDRDPSLAQTEGVKLYNAALLEAAGRRVIVQGTDENAIAIGIQRVLREQVLTICFLTGHDEYPSDNYEFHTHVEALGGKVGHSHGANAVVATVGHGIGRLRRALEALGHNVRDVTPAVDGVIDPGCRVLVDAGPRTPYSAIETAALENFLSQGGAALLMYDLGFEIGTAHGQLLNRMGIHLPAAVVVDRVQHYAGDPEMVAATSYDPHPITKRLSFTFYPGVRPLEIANPENGINTVALISTGANAVRTPLSAYTRTAPPAHSHEGDTEPEGGHRHDDEFSYRPAQTSATGVQVIAAASSGHITATAPAAFRAVVIGDSDFASNSFYPYMSNSRLALALVRWLSGDDSGPAVAPTTRTQTTIELSRDTQRTFFLLLVIGLPVAVATVGASVWWRRR